MKKTGQFALLSTICHIKGFPNFWAFIPLFHHESWMHNLAELKGSMNYLLNKLEILFIADAGECSEKQSVNLDRIRN